MSSYNLLVSALPSLIIFNLRKASTRYFMSLITPKSIFSYKKRNLWFSMPPTSLLSCLGFFNSFVCFNAVSSISNPNTNPVHPPITKQILELSATPGLNSAYFRNNKPTNKQPAPLSHHNKNFIAIKTGEKRVKMKDILSIIFSRKFTNDLKAFSICCLISPFSKIKPQASTPQPNQKKMREAEEKRKHCDVEMKKKAGKK
mmetsp:Transcript_26041/g.40638  ORF Transcript_26041/g.40638 Transcript_26041/m.40638 type:complete len:201 (-) Transcript_26041:276-878(-)